MGKASSSKKVARAARAAGKPGAGRNLAWPLTIGAIVAVGVLIIVVSRGGNEAVASPKLGEHWHAAYGIYDCDAFLPPLSDVVADETGLHTHADSLMHMHPFGTSYTGDGANIGNFGLTVGLEVTDTSFKAGGVERETGDACGDEEGVVQLKVWDNPDDAEGRLIEGDFADFAPQEFSMWVLAFVPEGTEIPKPPDEAIANLRAPADVVGATTTATTAPVDPDATTTTVAGETTTTVAGETTTTVAAEPPSTTVPATTP